MPAISNRFRLYLIAIYIILNSYNLRLAVYDQFCFRKVVILNYLNHCQNLNILSHPHIWLGVLS